MGMSRIAARKVVDLNAMDDDARHELGHALFAVQARVFSGVDEQAYYDHVLAPPARRNIVELYRNDAGELIGYSAVHLYDKEVNGAPVTMAWTQGGLLPEYRGGGTPFRIGMIEALREKFRHPFRPLWYLSCLVHTSSYHMLNKYFPRVYPSPGREMPGPLLDLTMELAAAFDLPVVDPADPLVRDDGWITVEPDPDAAATRYGHLPDVAYYIRRNPGYVHGHGMLVLVPLGFFDISFAIIRRLAAAVKRRG